MRAQVFHDGRGTISQDRATLHSNSGRACITSSALRSVANLGIWIAYTDLRSFCPGSLNSRTAAILTTGPRVNRVGTRLFNGAYGLDQKGLCRQADRLRYHSCVSKSARMRSSDVSSSKLFHSPMDAQLQDAQRTLHGSLALTRRAKLQLFLNSGPFSRRSLGRVDTGVVGGRR